MRTATFVLVTALAFPSAATWADDAPQGWEFGGVTQASATASVESRVTGYVTHLAVKEGDAVAKGDLVVEIDPRPYQLALDEARAKVKVAEARFKAARSAGANAERLLEKKVIGQEEAELKLAAEAEAQAALVLAKVKLERAQLTLSWTQVAAPFDGKVTRIRVTEGGLVTADQTPILTVVSTDPLHISFNVPEAVFLHLRRDGLADPGKLDVAIGYADEQGYLHVAKLDLISPEVDSKTGSVRFRGTVPNPRGTFLPGMSARVRLTPRPQ